MIEIAEAEDIAKLYDEIRTLEVVINSNLVGERARICCDRYRSKPGRVLRKASLKGRWVRIMQVRSCQGKLYINAEMESIYNSERLKLDHPFKPEQLELAP